MKSAQDPAPRLVTVNDAAKYFAVSVPTLYGWVYQRRIPFVKVGRALRFELVHLDALSREIGLSPDTSANYPAIERSLARIRARLANGKKRVAYGYLQKRSGLLD